MASDDTIIISGYKQKVRYYGMLTMPAWVIGASLLLNVATVLAILLRETGKAVGKDYIASRIFSMDNEATPAAIETYISRLRRKLAHPGIQIRTVHGLGYLLVDGQMTGRPATILAAILLFAVLGKLTDMALATLGARLVRWQDGFRPEGA